MAESKQRQRTIAVLGATGTQGSSVIKTLIEERLHSGLPKWKIQAVTRNTASPKAQGIRALAPDQIELAQADTSDVKSLRAAFRSCDAIFAVTDYWAPFFDAELRRMHASGPNPGESLRQWAYEDEIRHGKNIADAANAVLEEEGRLQNFIWSSLPSCSDNSKGKYNGIYHFDSKAKIAQYIREEGRQRGLQERMSVLYVGFYVSNMLKSATMRPIKQDNGKFLVQRLCPADAKHPFIITEADTGPLVKGLLEKKPGGTLLGYTAMLSWGEMTQIWGKAVGRDVEYREVTVEKFREYFPVEGEELLSATYSAEFGFAGGEGGVIEPPDVGIQARPDRVREWMERQDWSGVLEGTQL